MAGQGKKIMKHFRNSQKRVEIKLKLFHRYPLAKKCQEL